jgi:iron complex outermembrane recepter protein
MRPEKRKVFSRVGVVAIAMSFGLPFVADVGYADEGAEESLEPAVAGTRDDDILPTIIVTPAWRPVDLQQVPGSVNHYAGDELTATGIYNTLDLQYRTPGFVFKTNSVLGQPYLRGIGSDFVSAGAESSVATFIDGVYLPRAYDTIVDFFDVDRVEVLRGPQAVHLGRNVVGGAISIHSVEPRPEAGGYVDVTAGNFSQRQIRAALNAPLVSNDAGASVIVRLAGISTQRDGYVRNINLGTDANDDDFHALRGKLLLIPNDRLDLLLTFERHSEDSSRALGSRPRTDVGTNGGILMGGTVPDNPAR